MRNDDVRVGVPISGEGESAVWAEEENYAPRCCGNMVYS
jgi:hypothetical protein